MLFDTPIPTFPLDGGSGAHSVDSVQKLLDQSEAVHHFKDFAPLVD